MRSGKTGKESALLSNVGLETKLDVRCPVLSYEDVISSGSFMIVGIYDLPELRILFAIIQTSQEIKSLFSTLN